MGATSTPEYDAFGPWVLPVSSPEQVPPVFRAHPIDFTRAHDVLKVPRDVARRDVTPRSHLYDFLLVLDRDGIEVLTRQGHRFAVQRIARDDIAAVDIAVELLAARFSVLGTDGTGIDVAFNGASLPLITGLADRLLGWDDDPSSSGRGEALDQEAIGLRDVGLVNGHNALPHPDGARRVTAAYPERTPASRRSRVRRLVQGEARLSGAVASVDERHSVVVARADWVRHSRKPDLSLRRIVVASRAVTAVSSTPHAFLDGVEDVSVECGAARLRLTVPLDQERGVAAPFGSHRRTRA